jgi:hypothetical protein
MLNAPADALIDFAEVLARAKGTIEVMIRNSSSLECRLTYSGLSGSASQAHIHFAQLGVNGGIAAFLCGGGGRLRVPALPEA